MSRPNTTEVYTRTLVRAPKDEDYLVSLSPRISHTAGKYFRGAFKYGRRMGTRWMFAPPSSKASLLCGTRANSSKSAMNAMVRREWTHHATIRVFSRHASLHSQTQKTAGGRELLSSRLSLPKSPVVSSV